MVCLVQGSMVSVLNSLFFYFHNLFSKTLYILGMLIVRRYTGMTGTVLSEL